MTEDDLWRVAELLDNRPKLLRREEGRISFDPLAVVCGSPSDDGLELRVSLESLLNNRLNLRPGFVAVDVITRLIFVPQLAVIVLRDTDVEELRIGEARCERVIPQRREELGRGLFTGASPREKAHHYCDEGTHQSQGRRDWNGVLVREQHDLVTSGNSGRESHSRSTER